MLIDLLNAVSHVVPVMVAMHDSGFYSLYPRPVDMLMETVGIEHPSEVMKRLRDK